MVKRSQKKSTLCQRQWRWAGAWRHPRYAPLTLLQPFTLPLTPISHFFNLSHSHSLPSHTSLTFHTPLTTISHFFNLSHSPHSHLTLLQPFTLPLTPISHLTLVQPFTPLLNPCHTLLNPSNTLRSSIFFF